VTADRQTERTPPDRTAYQQQYYLTRREELAEAKRRRYEEDEAYRQGIRDASTASKERWRRARDQARLVEVAAPGNVCVGPRGPVQGYSLAAMAVSLGLSRDTVQGWARRGIFPATPYCLPGGRMLYSKEQIAAVVAALETYHERYPDVRRQVRHPERLRALIEGRWRALGELGDGA
jgi:hypothetical protein